MTLSIRNLGFKYGAITAVALIVVFLILRENEYRIAGLRYIHYIVMAGGITLAYVEVRKRIHMHRINYLPGLGTGLWTSLVAAVVYAIFKLIYTTAIDTDFVRNVVNDLPFRDLMTGPMLAFWDFWELAVFGVVLSFVVMQFFKRNRAPEEEAEEEVAEKHPERDLHPKV
jgi:hypothetical protein